MKGYDFHRQKPIDNYIVDFFCPKLNLIIEIDEVSHEFKGDTDYERRKRLESLELKFLRFSDINVKKNIPLVDSVTHPPAKAVPLFLEGNFREIPLRRGNKRGMFC